jgi:hypothetical protein
MVTSSSPMYLFVVLVFKMKGGWPLVFEIRNPFGILPLGLSALDAAHPRANTAIMQCVSVAVAAAANTPTQ